MAVNYKEQYRPDQQHLSGIARRVQAQDRLSRHVHSSRQHEITHPCQQVTTGRENVHDEPCG